jgi:hypothetical protein
MFPMRLRSSFAAGPNHQTRSLGSSQSSSVRHSIPAQQPPARHPQPVTRFQPPTSNQAHLSCRAGSLALTSGTPPFAQSPPVSPPTAVRQLVLAPNGNQLAVQLTTHQGPGTCLTFLQRHHSSAALPPFNRCAHTQARASAHSPCTCIHPLCRAGHHGSFAQLDFLNFCPARLASHSSANRSRFSIVDRQNEQRLSCMSAHCRPSLQVDSTPALCVSHAACRPAPHAHATSAIQTVCACCLLACRAGG